LKGRVGSDIFFYSITLSPEEDSPRALKAYAKMHGVGPGWTFLTGKPADILLLRKSLGFFYNNPKEDADRNNHSGNVVVGTEPLMRWAICQGGPSLNGSPLLSRPRSMLLSQGWSMGLGRQMWLCV
jgi:protein SCO1/2